MLCRSLCGRGQRCRLQPILCATKCMDMATTGGFVNKYAARRNVRGELSPSTLCEGIHLGRLQSGSATFAQSRIDPGVKSRVKSALIVFRSWNCSLETSRGANGHSACAGSASHIRQDARR